jgi:hypothetical protein
MFDVLKKIWKRFWDFIGFAGLLIGIIYMPADLFGLTDTYPALGRLVAMIDRFALLAFLAAMLVLYVLWMDLRPTIRGWMAPARIKKLYQHKLVSPGHRFSYEDPKRRGNTLYFQEARPVIPLINRADFPVHFRFETLKYVVNDQIECEDNIIPELSVIQPGQELAYTCKGLDWSQIPVEGAQIYVEFVLKYGDELRQPCTLQRRFTITTRKDGAKVKSSALDHPITK